jgi:mono/diheme cytochrome c family protein
MSPRRVGATSVLALGFLAGPAVPADPPASQLDRGFTETVRPFVQTYCVACHGGAQPAAQFDLRKYSDLPTVVADLSHWSLVLTRLSSGTMPPKVVKQPDPETRQRVVDWIAALRKEEARKNAGDPGIVLAHRLSNSEYNYTVRDLTGMDIRPAREFPVDPANPAGFDNTGESLSMSPALLNKYLQSAREVANHLVLKPDGIAFAPHPVLVETDRDKYCVNQITDFYKRQDTDYADYFLTAWRYKNRAALGKPKATLADFAAESKVSPKYLATIWQTLEETKEDIGPLAKLHSMWREVPAPNAAEPDAAKAACERMRDFVVQLRAKLELRFPDLAVPGISRTAQPFLMWRNRQYATHRRDYDRGALQVEGEVQAAPTQMATKAAENPDELIPAAPPPKRHPPDADLHVPAGQRPLYEAAFARFSAVFPDAFYIAERGRYFPDNTRDKGRYLSAGFHNLMGYFRDDAPLSDLILDGKQQKELDELWKELDFVASANIRTYIQFYLFESREAAKGPEGGATPLPDNEITSEARIRKVADSYLARARASKNATAIQAVEEHFKWVNDGIRWVESARIQAEPAHLKALQQFAEHAYRRPLTQAERDDLVKYYRSLRDKDGLSHEDAMRDSIVGVLMAPDFSYRMNLVASAATAKPARPGIAPLSGYSLASRLSYFLWSSMPDQQLLAHAAAGDLSNPEVLAAQARRMLKDDRARGLAVEFGGNWLDFRRFEENNAVDRERFPSFTNELREAMFEEPVRFFEDVIRNNRPVTDFVNGNDTFVNDILAQHYGIANVHPKPNEWVRVEDARAYGRGGLLGMSVFLTKNAPGLRTSPVKRGYWVVKRVLGEEIPPPPAAVPELPRDEAKMDLPLRDMLARHRQDPSCAACHQRFDGFGLAFEGYGPVGEKRTTDLAGRPVDARAAFPGGGEGEGMEGVRKFIREHRQNDFVENLCRKMLAYALGRSLMLSDEPAIEDMRNKLSASGGHFNTLVESIVTSPQFMTGRKPETVAAAQKGESHGR